MEIALLLLSIIAIMQLSYLIFAQTKPRLRSVMQKPVFVDTSALMDGRIVMAAQSGYIPAKLVIPNSVIEELQLLADTADPEKRSRARGGLDAVNQLQQVGYTTVEIFNDGSVGSGGVDERLRDLAKTHHGSICTIDFNLNKVARVEGIDVLNMNELAGSIRMAYLPGEKLSLEITQKGNDAHQGVGYLSDGTMVVVEKASSDIGKTIEIEFIRTLQTAAGRMMFAKKSLKSNKTSKYQKSTKQNKSVKSISNEDRLLSLVDKQ